MEQKKHKRLHEKVKIAEDIDETWMKSLLRKRTTRLNSKIVNTGRNLFGHNTGCEKGA